MGETRESVVREMGLLAYKFGWSREQCLDTPIRERKMWVELLISMLEQENSDKQQLYTDLRELEDLPRMKP
tara:strand:+ start:446 stop:658 length:213 start_codon:yes stop_codon:yes gene_type:complete